MFSEYTHRGNQDSEFGFGATVVALSGEFYAALNEEIKLQLASAAFITKTITCKKNL